MNHNSKQASRQVSRVISFTSGKGGVGKTSLVVNTAIALARLGRTVLVIDADLGLANVDVMLGLRPSSTLLDFFEGRKKLQQIMLPGPEGISIVPAASGVESLCRLTAEQQLMLQAGLEELGYGFDYILLDTEAGIGSNVMYFNSASTEIICVVNDEPTSLTDAYALMKVLSQGYGEKKVSVLVNNTVTERDALKAYARLESAVERFLHISIDCIGFVPRDAAFCEAVREQTALLQLYPSSSAALALTSLVRRMDQDFQALRVKGGMQFFFKQLVEMNSPGA